MLGQINRVDDRCIADFTCLHARQREIIIDFHEIVRTGTVLFANFNESAYLSICKVIQQ